jgi:hypothetical protein
MIIQIINFLGVPVAWTVAMEFCEAVSGQNLQLFALF